MKEKKLKITQVAINAANPRTITEEKFNKLITSILVLPKMLSEALNNEALGFAIAMKGKHLCKTMRGVRNDGNMCVSHFTGVFQFNSELRKEFYKLIDLQNRKD